MAWLRRFQARRDLKEFSILAADGLPLACLAEGYGDLGHDASSGRLGISPRALRLPSTSAGARVLADA